MKLYWYSFEENKVMSGIIDESKLESNFDGISYEDESDSTTYYDSIGAARTLALAKLDVDKAIAYKDIIECTKKLRESRKRFKNFNDLYERIKNYNDHDIKAISDFIVQAQYLTANSKKVWLTISRHKTMERAIKVYNNIKNSSFTIQCRISQEIIK